MPSDQPTTYTTYTGEQTRRRYLTQWERPADKHPISSLVPPGTQPFVCRGIGEWQDGGKTLSPGICILLDLAEETVLARRGRGI